MKALRPILAGSALLALTLHPPPAGAAAGPPQPRRMFTTCCGSGDLGSWPDAGAATGVAAGDAICRARAAAAGLPNSGAYAAWLSDGTTDAYCHLLGVAGTRAGGCGAGLTAGPWLRTDGKAFSGDLDELTATGPIRPPVYDEDGDLVVSPSELATPWTGTRPDGTLDPGLTCNDWTDGLSAPGRVGRGSRTLYHWTEQVVMNGIATHRLLCFETGDGAPLPEPEEEAGLVFASSAIGSGDLGSWPQAGGADGLAAGDAICRTLARDAGLPDPDGFVAWLSTSTADAIDRLGGFPGPWKRVDGAVAVRLGPAGPEMETTLNVAERRQVTGYWAWTGTDNDGGWAGAGEDCGGWTVATGPPPSGAWGWMTDLVYWSNNDNSVDCSATLHLYCFGTAMVLFLDGFEIGSAVRWSAAVP